MQRLRILFPLIVIGKSIPPSRGFGSSRTALCRVQCRKRARVAQRRAAPANPPNNGANPMLPPKISVPGNEVIPPPVTNPGPAFRDRDAPHD